MRAVVGPRNTSGLSVDEWAYRLGHAVSTMYAKGTEGVPFTLKDLVKITAHGHLSPLRWLAAVGKCVVFQRPTVPADNPLNQQVASAIIKFGEYLQAVAEAQDPAGPGGAKIIPTEAARIKGRAEEVVADLAAIIEGMADILERDRAKGNADAR